MKEVNVIQFILLVAANDQLDFIVACFLICDL